MRAGPGGACGRKNVCISLAMALVSLSREMISWEPVTMVSPPHNVDSGAVDDSSLPLMATLELSNTDLILDYYMSVLLFYDVHSAAPFSTQQKANTQSMLQEEPASRRLLRALKELLLHYPCAAGRLVRNEMDGRLEVRYPVPASSTASVLAAAPGDCNCKNLSNPAQQLASLDIQYPCKAPNIHGHDADTHSTSRYGVQFHVAHASVTLSDLGDVSDAQPSFDLLYPSMPPHGYTNDGNPSGRFIMAFQVTTFKCGGFCLAHTCSHLYADGYTGATFLQNLCSIARGERLANPPDFSLSRRVALRAREPPSPTMQHTFIKARNPGTAQEPVLSKFVHQGTAKRYVVSMDALDTLRRHVSKPDQSKPYSRHQALMALLWTACARVRFRTQGLPGSHELELRFPINLRTKGIPNISTSYSGNALYQCTVSATLEELCESPLAYVVEKIKDKLRSLDLTEGLQSMIDDIELKLRDGLVPYIGGDNIGMPSLVGLPFYDTDCGRPWGRPIYVSRPSRLLSNRYIILEHPAAQAWNVLCVFGCMEERECFEECITDSLNCKLH